MVTPRVSIIIPAYKSAPYLGATLRSVLDQTYPSIEIIVVDDGSPDNSSEVAASFPGVVCIRQPNQGVCAARNTGLKHATGEYVIFLDGDDLLLPDTVEIGVRELLARPQCAYAYGHSRMIDEAGNSLEHPTPWGELHDERRIEHASYQTLLAGNATVPPATACFRRSVLDSVGGFEVGRKLADDYELYLRIARTHPIHCHNRIVADYRQHAGNTCRLSATSNLRAVLDVLDRERQHVRDRSELQRAIRVGRHHWAQILGPSLAPEMVGCIMRRRFAQAFRASLAIVRHYPRGLAEYCVARARQARTRSLAKSRITLEYRTESAPMDRAFKRPESNTAQLKDSAQSRSQTRTSASPPQ